MKGRSRTIIFMLLLAFLHSWMQSSKVATVLALQNSLPMFPCIASAATNVWPFPRYLMDVVSAFYVFTHCARPANKYQFLFWPLRLSGLSQMRFSLNWRINCSHAYAKSGALRPAIAWCQRIQYFGLLGVLDANVSLKVTRRLTNRCSLVETLGSTITFAHQR